MYPPTDDKTTKRLGSTKIIMWRRLEKKLFKTKQGKKKIKTVPQLYLVKYDKQLSSKYNATRSKKRLHASTKKAKRSKRPTNPKFRKKHVGAPGFDFSTYWSND
jgi:hypothetical protein